MNGTEFGDMWEREDLVLAYENYIQVFLDQAANPLELEEALWNEYPEWAMEELIKHDEEII